MGDFHHASTTTVYPTIGCGDVGADYMFQWTEGPVELPVGAPGVFGTINTTTTDTDIIDIYDLALDAGVDYRVKFMEGGNADVQVALFVNSANAEYWQGRDNSAWELSDPTDSYVFTAPVTDIYGLVVFGDEIDGSSTYSLEIERYDDCTPLPTESCVTSVGYPLDFSFDAGGYWAAVGVVPSEGDDKDIHVYTGCDGEGTQLTGSQYLFGADFVVGDFNHVAGGTYNARILFGDPDALYSFDSDRGISAPEDMFPLNTMVEGALGNFGIDCRQLRIWDVFLEAGEAYQIGLTRSGQSDIHVALFHNPGNGAYWVGRANSEWETPAHSTFNYSPPASDWYGLVAFANKREGAGTYTIRIDHVGTGTGVDPEPLVPDQFALYQNTPNPFNPSTVIRYDVPAGGASVSLRIFDVNGRLVKTLVSETLSPGEKSATWHGDDDRGNRVASGVYFYSIETPGFRETRKLVLMK